MDTLTPMCGFTEVCGREAGTAEMLVTGTAIDNQPATIALPLCDQCNDMVRGRHTGTGTPAGRRTTGSKKAIRQRERDAYNVIERRLDVRGECRDDDATLADLMGGCSTRTVREALARLEGHGYLRRDWEGIFRYRVITLLGDDSP